MVVTDKSSQAEISFTCQNNNCKATIQFRLLDMDKEGNIILCPQCHESYQFDRAFVRKLALLKNLINAIRDAEEILDDTHIAVITPAGEVKLPYRLLLTRLDTAVTINGIEFLFRVEPLSNTPFR